jgi:hypothetical protein
MAFGGGPSRTAANSAFLITRMAHGAVLQMGLLSLNPIDLKSLEKIDDPIWSTP